MCISWRTLDGLLLLMWIWKMFLSLLFLNIWTLTVFTKQFFFFVPSYVGKLLIHSHSTNPFGIGIDNFFLFKVISRPVAISVRSVECAFMPYYHSCFTLSICPTLFIKSHRFDSGALIKWEKEIHFRSSQIF